MFELMAVFFVLGYLAIALEHPLRINKAASALLTGVAIWTILMMGAESIFPDESLHGHTDLIHKLEGHLGEIAGILFFLMGAMMTVEIIDVYGGFRVVTDKITATKKVTLMWIVGFLTFGLSAVLDNLTTTIVMCALLRKLIGDKETLLVFGGVVIISANAGGAWSPIGDVTTIMLWVGGQVSTLSIITKLILPSLVCMVLPLLWIGRTLKGEITQPENTKLTGHHKSMVTKNERNTVFWLGIFALLFVPIFKAITHLPPFLGIMVGLGVLWVVTEIIHMRSRPDERGDLLVSAILRRIDMPSVLFFLGILVAVAGLQVAGHLKLLAHWLDSTLGGDVYLIAGAIGINSAVFDNIPLVAAAIGMYPSTQYGMDHIFWELLALCAGTGGSILIIGSAAGVAAMGILQMNFIWYLKKVTLPALLGYLGGIVTFWLMWG